MGHTDLQNFLGIFEEPGTISLHSMLFHMVEIMLQFSRTTVEYVAQLEKSTEMYRDPNFHKARYGRLIASLDYWGFTFPNGDSWGLVETNGRSLLPTPSPF